MRLFIIAVLIFPLTLFSQISGLGIFKIGQNKENILNEVKLKTGKSLIIYDDIINSLEYKYSQNDLYITSLDTKKAFKNLDIPGVKFDSLRQDIDINFYEIAGIRINNIGLVFYKDTLIRFRCAGSDSLFEAIKTKYGNPKESKNTNIIKCVNRLTGSFELEESEVIFQWNEPNSPIKATYTDGIKYDEKCNKLLVLELVIEDVVKWNITLSRSFEKPKFDSKDLKDF